MPFQKGNHLSGYTRKYNTKVWTDRMKETKSCKKEGNIGQMQLLFITNPLYTDTSVTAGLT